MSIIYRKTPRWFILFLVGLCFTFPVMSQSDHTGERRVTGTYLISNATVIPSPGRSLANTSILIKNGVIDAIGTNIQIPPNAQEIKGDSLYIYPGFIDGGSTAGVSKPKDAERPSNFNSSSPPDDVAGITPYRSVLDYYDPESNQVNDWRKLGFTMSQLLPEGGMFPGKAAIVIYGHKESTNIFIENTALYATMQSSRGMYPGTLLGVMAKFRSLYRNAELSSRHSILFVNNPDINRPERNKVLEAFYPTLDQSLPILIAVEDDLAIRRAIGLQKELGFKLILTGVAQAHNIVSLLNDNQVAVFLSLNLPEDKMSKIKDDEETDAERETRIERVKEAYKEALEEAGKFEREGIAFGFTTKDAKVSDVMKNIRLMIENGLSEEAALAALTVNPSRILGIDRHTGTIERGKLANLVITTDSLFKEDTQIKHVFADGYVYDYETKIKKVTAEGAAEVALEGTWEYVAKAPQGDSRGKMVFQREGDGYTGSITLDNPEGNGQITTSMNNIEYIDHSLRFDFSIDIGGNFLTFNVSGKIEGNDFDGNLDVADIGSFPIHASKQPNSKR